jgi:hypothetical protein
MQAGSVDKRTVHIQRMEECTDVRIPCSEAGPTGVCTASTGVPLELWQRRVQRSNLGDRWHCGYHCCGGCEGEIVPGHSKTPPARWDKNGSDLSLARWEGMDTSGSENETRLVVGGPPGWWLAGLAASPALGSRPKAVWDTRLSCIVCAGP